MIEALLAGVKDVDEVARQTHGNFDSTIRNRALLLLAMLDAAPDDPRIPALVERLTRDLNDTWWSTQESAFVLSALGQLAHRQHALAPYSGTLLVDDTVVGQTDIPRFTPTRFPPARVANLGEVTTKRLRAIPIIIHDQDHGNFL